MRDLLPDLVRRYGSLSATLLSPEGPLSPRWLSVLRFFRRSALQIYCDGKVLIRLSDRGEFVNCSDGHSKEVAELTHR
jgi:hypothetical protein